MLGPNETNQVYDREREKQDCYLHMKLVQCLLCQNIASVFSLVYFESLLTSVAKEID